MHTANENMIGSATLAGQDSAKRDFVDLYIALRQVEKRMYSDETLKKLPHIDENDLYRKEWQMRYQSCKRLIKYLNAKNRQLDILEVGCGNGWLSSQIAKNISSAKVIGLDINLPELEQGRRVFRDQSNLCFVCGDIRSEIPGQKKFDMIIFAASIQYFKDFSTIVKTSLDILKKNGEIHILDSHFYTAADLSEARNRSIQYFKEMGFENMKDLYFHHSLEELSKFEYDILYNPRSILNWVSKNRNPFRWICIKSKK